MKEKSDKQKYQARYEEISLPVSKIRKSGNSLVIVIPNTIVEKHSLTEGKRVLPILHIRKKSFFYADELRQGEKWCKLTSAERVKLQSIISEDKKIEEIARKL